MKHFLFFSLVLFSVNSLGFSEFEDHPLTDFGSLHDANSSETVDHSTWDALLSRHVTRINGVNHVAYGEFPEDDRQQLNRYIDILASTPVTQLNRDQQFAYWVNMYNALTVQLILDHYPVKSIRKISFSLLSWGPWDEQLITVEGRDLTLNDIEHRILRPVFRDPRIHYVVNCASIGCPNLPARSLAAHSLESVLDAAARDFINHPRGVSLEDGELVLSKIFDWYADDFGDSNGELVAHLGQFADPELKAILLTNPEIGDYRYDWSLNDVPR